MLFDLWGSAACLIRYDYRSSSCNSILQFGPEASYDWDAGDWLWTCSFVSADVGVRGWHWSCFQRDFSRLDYYNSANHFIPLYELSPSSVFFTENCNKFMNVPFVKYLNVVFAVMSTKALLKGIETWKKETLTKKVD